MIKKYFLATLTITFLVLYVVFIALAMLFYTGGTESNPMQTGYAFWENSLSDLGMITAYNGMSNTYSMALFTLGTTMFGLSFFVFNIGFPIMFQEQKLSKILALIASIFGYFVAVGMIGVAFTPHTTLPILHMISVYIAYISLFFSTTFYAIAIFMNKSIRNAYGIISAVFAIIFFATLIMNLLGLSGASGILEIGQKIGRGLTVITYIVISIPMLKD